MTNSIKEKIEGMIKPIPYYKQETNYTCGAACMRMILESMGIKRSEKQVSNLLKTNKIIGTWHKNISELAEKYKFDYVIFRDAKILDLIFYQDTGWKTIVCFTKEKIPHYAVVKKINWHSLYLLDPYYGPKVRYTLSNFKRKWHDQEGERWFMAIKKNPETKIQKKKK